jgi:hypothetical protein
MTPTLPLGHEPVESPSAVRHVDESFGSERLDMSFRPELKPNGLQGERLKAEWRLRVIYERNYTVSMEMSFFIMPSQRRAGRPLQTVRTSNSSLFHRTFVCVRGFEVAR